MNTPTLSQLADIGAAAALQHVTGTYAVAVNTRSTSWQADAPAREAFAKAVLDAVGYKFPVDPEREDFERWLARQGEDNKPDLSTVWQAGKASTTTTEPPQPETFEAHGLTWTKHTPGDPMPCDGDAMLQVFWDSDFAENSSSVAGKAADWDWECTEHGMRVIGWRYADTP
jgi:hypothetical protein